LRIDQFLSESRIIKRRVLAKEACSGKLVYVDGQAVKPSKEVQVESRIRIEFADRTLEVLVLEIPRGNVRKDLAKNLYRVIREEYKKVELI
jgi:ribosomal 50S subunit-recycling heat shock protein